MKRTGMTALLSVCLFLAVSCGDDGTKTIPDNAQVPDESAVTDDTTVDDQSDQSDPTDQTDQSVTDDTVTDDTVTDDTVTDDTVVDNETPDEDTAPAYNFNGKWAMLNFTTSNVTTTVPIIGETKSVSTTSSYALVGLTDNGDGTVSAVATPCETLIDSGSNLLSVTISDNYISHLKPMIWDFTTILDRSGVGFDVTATDILMLNGVKDLADPLNDPLPTDKNDTHIYDQDEDGKPGMTVNCKGSIIGGDGWMATIQRTVNDMVGETQNDTLIEGALIWESEQIVLEASSNTLMNEKTVEPDYANSWFKMVRLVDQNWTCSEIKANKDTLFPQ
ncbi:MAG TPA: hypothetical protein P5077_13615 [bacterium]|nr:hypothetical protein [bacterium]